MIKRNKYKILILLLMTAMIVYVLTDPEALRLFGDAKKIKSYVYQFSIWAPIAFIVLFALRSLLIVFPAAIFGIISGSMFGVAPGFLYSLTGAFLAASLAFFIGRYLARDVVKKCLSDRIHFLHKKPHNGFKIILYLRLIMIMPYDAFSYAVGTTKITYRDFILGTVLGIMPEFLMYSYLGDLGLNSDISLKEKIIISAVVLSAIFVGHNLKEFFIKHLIKE